MTLRARAIEVAGADGNSVVVAGGLSALQEVVVAGVHVLRDGEKVRRYRPATVSASSAAASAASR
jgi:multidrug efflux system membrane fusion protein